MGFRSKLMFAAALAGATAPLHAQLPVFSIGEPTGEEQLYLELINRARANPQAEVERLITHPDPSIRETYAYFGVNLQALRAEFASIGPMPPIAMNGFLLKEARKHSRDQFDHGYQGHEDPGGKSPQQRVIDSGYPGNLAGENIYVAALSVEHGHAGFEVEWGHGPNGMLYDRRHRNAIHGGIRDVGVGIYQGQKVVNGEVFGPQVITQTFGNPTERLPRVTGVAYYDLTGNGFYDPGEGIGGISVEIPTANWRGLTADSGGYTVPVPRVDGPLEVRFIAPGLNVTKGATIVSAQSVKVDLIPPYEPPSVNGPALPALERENRYTFTPTGGATAYEWRWNPRKPAQTDGAEALTKVEAQVSPRYSPLTGDARAAGAASYHLAHVAPEKQVIRYRDSFLGGQAPALRYHSRLGWATTSQHARVEISLNDGLSWIPVDTQSGTNNAGQSGFAPREVPLPAAAGREFLLRFVFDIHATSTFVTGAEAGKGWYIDEITVQDALELADSVIRPVEEDHAFTFTPKTADPQLLSVRPIISGKPFPWGTPLEVIPAAVTGNPPPPEPSFAIFLAEAEKQAGLPEGTLAASDGDFNDDGVPDLIAYALNLSPVEPAADALPQPSVSDGKVHLDYTVDLSKPDVWLKAEASADMVNWFAAGEPGAPAGFEDAALSTEGTLETRRASVPIGQRPVFLRLKSGLK